MGVHQQIYLGPYIEFSVKLEEQKISYCPQPKVCPQPTEGYCPKCGKAASQIFVIRQKPSPQVDFYEDYKEALTPVLSKTVGSREVSWAIPNNHRPGEPARGSRFEDRDISVAVVPEMIERETEWFETAFGPELEKLRNQVGHADVVVRWGLVTWYS